MIGIRKNPNKKPGRLEELTIKNPLEPVKKYIVTIVGLSNETKKLLTFMLESSDNLTKNVLVIFPPELPVQKEFIRGQILEQLCCDARLEKLLQSATDTGFSLLPFGLSRLQTSSSAVDTIALVETALMTSGKLAIKPVEEILLNPNFFSNKKNTSRN
ncbi:hypothetical protein A2533_00970 [Candidatus Falkowbacteria bacterium RIFOXYD2_FULL_35_9]|uniref:Uncharacterized protein n=1 Tax=Candidatus Falkowbacteria bacterium RIFOXYC2_FULL_36_12 TaxID=1798002 RepID=A0A1F5SYH2_9BACT|nr:MAG: hypothetical protein A2478_04615 [Candidatus Falkowbacteria bacterium RIFOXYC2_FULL_36_12]OGF34074.1 MAG: hypothetical protein A2223_04375 [Candidatus Falkowbacteria bacterium RIFOXYA2_FULL_35_8]OGF48432.1 MAG: hypothetical protein A2533_00970 [Candidatus Falkowbacteria bacterium RIFOXYD2_FULL_35_9]